MPRNYSEIARVAASIKQNCLRPITPEELRRVTSTCPHERRERVWFLDDENKFTNEIIVDFHCGPGFVRVSRQNKHPPFTTMFVTKMNRLFVNYC
jgi:hypothetical protein